MNIDSLFPPPVSQIIMGYTGDMPFQPVRDAIPPSSEEIPGSFVVNTTPVQEDEAHSLQLHFAKDPIHDALKSVDGNSQRLSNAQKQSLSFVKQYVRRLDLTDTGPETGLLNQMARLFSSKPNHLQIKEIVTLFASSTQESKVRATKIEALVLSADRIDPQVLAELAACKNEGLLPKLKSLTIHPSSENQPLSQEAISALVQSTLFTDLVHLDIQTVNHELLAACPQLTSLTVRPHHLNNDLPSDDISCLKAYQKFVMDPVERNFPLNKLLLTILDTVNSHKLPSLRWLSVKAATNSDVCVQPLSQDYLKPIFDGTGFKKLVGVELCEDDVLTFRQPGISSDLLKFNSRIPPQFPTNIKVVIPLKTGVLVMQRQPEQLLISLDAEVEALTCNHFTCLHTRAQREPVKGSLLTIRNNPSRTAITCPSVIQRTGIPFHVLKLDSLKTSQNVTSDHNSFKLHLTTETLSHLKEIEFHNMLVADISQFVDVCVTAEATSLHTVLLELNDKEELLRLPQLLKLPSLRKVKAFFKKTSGVEVYSLYELKALFINQRERLCFY